MGKNSSFSFLPTTKEGINSSLSHGTRKISWGISRRTFLKALGVFGTSSLLPSSWDEESLATLLAEKPGTIEKRELTIGFLPITCAAPILMAEALDLYRQNGLRVTLRRVTGWAMARDLAIQGELDASHMLIPMPLSITLGIDCPAMPFVVPVFSNTAGSALTLHKKYIEKIQEPKDFRGLKLCIPFSFSMHNYLLRYYLARGGVDPDREVELRVVPPPEMLANLKAGNIDGYIVAEPFNQRAVYDNVGFLFTLSNTWWPQHPCCGVAIPKAMADTLPHTFHALVRALVQATLYCQDPAHRESMAKILSDRNYLNQPEIVLRQVLTGTFANGKGEIVSDPGRIGYDPYPWESMAMWILTQMRRWKQVSVPFDMAHVARSVFLASYCDAVLQEIGASPRGAVYRQEKMFGDIFDPANAERYLQPSESSHP